MFFFYKHNVYKHVQDRIGPKNKHKLSIMAKIESTNLSMGHKHVQDRIEKIGMSKIELKK